MLKCVINEDHNEWLYQILSDDDFSYAICSIPDYTGQPFVYCPFCGILLEEEVV